MKDFYYILGLNSNCTSDEIKEAYRKLSKKLHPDLNQGDEYFANRFREVTEAYDTLSDPGKRSRFDAELKKAKSNPTGEEHYRRQNYQRQAENYRYKTPPSAFYKSKRGPGMGMTVTLILIGLVIAVYLVESFSGSKAHKVNTVSMPAAAPLKTHKHHKKKHDFKNKTGSDSIQLKGDSNVHKPVQLAAVTGKNELQAIKPQPSTESHKTAVYSGTYLYVSYLKANVTGVINMRASDDFNSSIIQTIPATSKVYVIEKGNAYYKVAYNNYVGYIPRWSLEVK